MSGRVKLLLLIQNPPNYSWSGRSLEFVLGRSRKSFIYIVWAGFVWVTSAVCWCWELDVTIDQKADIGTWSSTLGSHVNWTKLWQLGDDFSSTRVYSFSHKSWKWKMVPKRRLKFSSRPPFSTSNYGRKGKWRSMFFLQEQHVGKKGQTGRLCMSMRWLKSLSTVELISVPEWFSILEVH